MVKKLLWLIMVWVLVLHSGAAAALTRIKFSLVGMPGSPQNVVAEKFKELIEPASNGNINVQILYAQPPGSENEILHKIRVNTVQMGVVTGGALDKFDSIVRVINYPFLFKDNEQAHEIIDGPLGIKILKSLKRAGFKGLCFSENGFRNLTNNIHPVKSPGDIKGLKIRVMASALHIAVWKALGADPVPMPWPIYKELAMGAIDGQENTLWTMEVYKFYEIQKYMTLTRHVYSPHINVASLKWWKTLDEDTQDLIQRTIREAAVFQRKDNRSKNADQLARLSEKGMRIEFHPDLDAFRAKVAGLKNTDLYSEPRVLAMLIEMLNAAK